MKKGSAGFTNCTPKTGLHVMNDKHLAPRDPAPASQMLGLELPIAYPWV